MKRQIIPQYELNGVLRNNSHSIHNNNCITKNNYAKRYVYALAYLDEIYDWYVYDMHFWLL